MVVSKLKSTLASGQQVKIGNDDAIRVRHLSPTTARVEWPIKGSKFLLHALDLHEGQRIKLPFGEVYFTLLSAAKAPFVKIAIEAPFSVKIHWPRKPVQKPAQSLRRLQLPGDCRGSLHLHSMPGRYETMAAFADMAAEAELMRIVVLAPQAEIAKKAPQYAELLEGGNTPWLITGFPIPDFGVPQDRSAFWDLATAIAEAVRYGEQVLVHCAGGIGRTGMFACAVLIRLGYTPDDAEAAVRKAGSGPETAEQKALIRAPIEHL